MYGKLIDGVLINAPNPLSVNGKVYYNPSAEIYEAEGYKEVVDTPYPEAEGDMKYYTHSYEEQNDKIVKVWNESEPPAESEPQPTVEDRLVGLETGLQNTDVKLEATMEAVDYLLMGDEVNNNG